MTASMCTKDSEDDEYVRMEEEKIKKENLTQFCNPYDHIVLDDLFKNQLH